MIRDTLRAALAIAVMAAAAGIVLETRQRLIALEHAGRMIAGPLPPAHAYAAPTTPTQVGGRLQQLGRAAIEFADAAMSVVR